MRRGSLRSWPQQPGKAVGTGAHRGAPPALPGGFARSRADLLDRRALREVRGSRACYGQQSAECDRGDLFCAGAFGAPVAHLHVTVLVHPDLCLALAEGLSTALRPSPARASVRCVVRPLEANTDSMARMRAVTSWASLSSLNGIQPRRDRRGQLFCLESMLNPAVLCGLFHRSYEAKAAASMGLPSTAANCALGMTDEHPGRR